jgi:sulfoxide reductase heme-binding subunit YedZ
MKSRRNSRTLLRVIVHLGALLPLVWLVYDYFSGRLSVNPILDLEQRTGRTALTLLILSLSCTPLHSLFGWREILRHRRTLGLYAFMYAAIHLSIFVFLDYGANFGLILADVWKRPFIIIGAITFLVLLSLAITSFDVTKVWLGKNWKRLHRLVFLAAGLDILHYAWARKGDIFHLQGDIIRPLIYALILLVLLLLRFRPIRKFIQSHHLQF